MPASSVETFASARTKIKRAKKHIADLDAVRRTFLESNPYEVRADHDPHLPQLNYVVVSVKDSPLDLAPLTGDAIQNLRCALDHAVFPLWKRRIFRPGLPEDHVAFPVFKFDTTKNETKFRGVVEGSRQDVIDAIRAMEAHKGGKGHQLWALHELNNRDKHRALLTAARGVASGFNLGAALTRQMQARVGEANFPMRDLFISPQPWRGGLKVGDVLLTVPEKFQIDEKTDFSFDVTFNEPGVVEGEPLIETLQHFADLVSNTVSLLESLP